MVNALTQDEVELLCQKAGFWVENCKIGAAIALCEAPYTKDNVAHANFDAIGDQGLANDTWGFSYGGFQIRSLRVQKGTGGPRDEEKLLDPLFNAKSARSIKLAQGWGAWSTYSSGMYKAYLQDQFPPPPNSYIVIAGDSLSKITVKLGNKWPWTKLAEVNGITYPYTIKIGQVLILPWEGTGV